MELLVGDQNDAIEEGSPKLKTFKTEEKKRPIKKLPIDRVESRTDHKRTRKQSSDREEKRVQFADRPTDARNPQTNP